MQGRDIATIIAVAVLIVLLFGLLGGGMMMGWGMMGGFGFGFSPVYGIIMAVFWVSIVVGIIALVVWLFQQGRPTEAGPGAGLALDILRERYAKGEITREQFEQMRRDLEGK
ncbi:MAG: SHOCT domain-containing protein [Chloroflexi bacterium]|nr:SHOCT domain-containing protein [Chloroflexota bacterium]